MNTLSNVQTREGESNPSCISIASDAFPVAESSRNGVSVKYAHDATKNWYVFRASYGRTSLASDILIEDGTYTYVARRYAVKYQAGGGKKKKVLEDLIPNILFAYTTAEKAEYYVKYSPELSFLSYYYNHFELDANQKNPPLIVSCKEMENFILATCNHSEHLMFINPSQCHFKGGDIVKVIDGAFKGVKGRVARVAGQQRVVLSISEVGLISTAYIPTAFIEKIDGSRL